MELKKITKIVFFILLLVSVLNLVNAQQQIAQDDFESNTFSGGIGWNGAWSYSGVCEITGLGNPLGNYHMRGDEECDAVRNFDDSSYNIVNVTFYATATSLENGEYCRYYYYDGTSYHELLSLTNGDDDGEHDYYNFNVSGYETSSSAGIRIYGGLGGADYCYLDNITIIGETVTELGLYTENQYLTGETDVIEADSSLTNTEHTFELAYPNGTVFCNKTLSSPSVPKTVFSTTCDMPSTIHENATATLYVTDDRSQNTTNYFDIIQAQKDSSKIDIKKVYFSEQVLQGGSTEIFALLSLGENVTLNRISTTITFPDGTRRELSMEETANSNEYRAFITDTYRVGVTYFTVRAESGVHYDTYTNQYEVAAYNPDFVDVVNRVDELLYQPPGMDFMGTYYEVLDYGKIFLQLVENDEAINNAVCDVTIYNPDNSVYLWRQTMSYVPESAGLYYYDLIIPNVTGVYMLNAYCQYLEYWYDSVLTNFSSGQYVSGTLENLTSSDDTYVKFIEEEISPAEWNLTVDFLFENVSYDNFTTSYSVIIEGHTTDSHEMNISIWDYISSTWYVLPNKLKDLGESSVIGNLVDSNLNNYVQNNQSKIRVSLTDQYENKTSILTYTKREDDGGREDEEVIEDENIYGKNYSIPDPSSIQSIGLCAYVRREGVFQTPYVRLNNNVTNISISDTGENNWAIKCVDLTSHKNFLNEGYNAFGITCDTCKGSKVWKIGVDTTAPLNGSLYASGTTATWTDYPNDVMLWINYTTETESSYLYLDRVELKLSKYNETPVLSIRGGSELNVKDRLAGIENSLDYIETSTSQTNIQFVSSQIYNLNDTGIIATRLSYSSEGIIVPETNAYCYANVYGPANQSTVGPVLYNHINLTEFSEGLYYLKINPQTLGIYTAEVTCSNSGRNYYSGTVYRVEDDITSLSINGLTNLIQEMNLAFFEGESNITPYTISGIYKDYLNESVAMIFSGTEYSSGETGTIALQILKSLAAGGNEPITNLNCNSTIYYPEFDGIYESKIMNFSQDVYYHNFSVPNRTGVYINTVICTTPQNKEYYGMHTFHVAPWINTIKDMQATVNFINNTTIEINGTTHNIYNYLQNAIYSILVDINSSIENNQADLTSIESKLVNIQSIVNTISDFTQEQVFLITDSIGLLQPDNSEEQDVQESLGQIQNNLERFIEIQDKKEDSPSFRIYSGNLDSGLIILGITIIAILILSQFNGLKTERELKKQKKRELEKKKSEIKLPSRNDKNVVQ